MSFQKKNVIQGFIRDDFVPTPGQFLVKYLSGKGNNLHEVECFDGSTILVSMPKKYRQTVWLKKGDCLVIDRIDEGKKVKGEIICLIPEEDALRDLIKCQQWPASCDSSSPVDPDALLNFFDRGAAERKSNRDNFDPFPSSGTESSDMESEEEEEDDGDDDDDDGGTEDDEEEQDGSENGDEDSRSVEDTKGDSECPPSSSLKT